MNCRLLHRIDRAVLQLLYPAGVCCLACNRPSDGSLLCEACTQALARPEDRADADGSVWRHSGVPARLVRALKDRALADAAQPLAAGMAEKARQLALPPDTVVTSVCMPEKRRRRRGIDHGQTLAEALAVQLGLPYRPLLRLVRVPRHTQRGLNRKGRLRNLSGCFIAHDCAGMSILLVDDVWTTGATMKVCTQALIDGGARAVFTLTATRA